VVGLSGVGPAREEELAAAFLLATERGRDGGEDGIPPARRG